MNNASANGQAPSEAQRRLAEARRKHQELMDVDTSGMNEAAKRRHERAKLSATTKLIGAQGAVDREEKDKALWEATLRRPTATYTRTVKDLVEPVRAGEDVESIPPGTTGQPIAFTTTDGRCVCTVEGAIPDDRDFIDENPDTWNIVIAYSVLGHRSGHAKIAMHTAVNALAVEITRGEIDMISFVVNAPPELAPEFILFWGTIQLHNPETSFRGEVKLPLPMARDIVAIAREAWKDDRFALVFQAPVREEAPCPSA
jgi:hypothetical protein